MKAVSVSRETIRFDLFWTDIIDHIKGCEFLTAPEVLSKLCDNVHISIVTMEWSLVVEWFSAPVIHVDILLD